MLVQKTSWMPIGNPLQRRFGESPPGKPLPFTLFFIFLTTRTPVIVQNGKIKGWKLHIPSVPINFADLLGSYHKYWIQPLPSPQTLMYFITMRIISARVCIVAVWFLTNCAPEQQNICVWTLYRYNIPVNYLVRTSKLIPVFAEHTRIFQLKRNPHLSQGSCDEADFLLKLIFISNLFWIFPSSPLSQPVTTYSS